MVCVTHGTWRILIKLERLEGVVECGKERCDIRQYGLIWEVANMDACSTTRTGPRLPTRSIIRIPTGSSRWCSSYVKPAGPQPSPFLPALLLTEHAAPRPGMPPFPPQLGQPGVPPVPGIAPPPGAAAPGFPPAAGFPGAEGGAPPGMAPPPGGFGNAPPPAGSFGAPPGGNYGH